MKKLILFFVLLLVSCNSKPTDTPEIEPLGLDSVALTSETPIKSESKKDEKKAKALSSFFKVKKDEFENTEWIIPKSAPTYRNYNAFYCYFAIDKGNASNLRFVLSYVNDDWLFIRNAKFLVDGEVFDYFPQEVKKDNGSGEIWEWWDESVSVSDFSMLKKISEAKSAKIKLNGDQYYDTVVITQKQKQNLKKTIDYYEALGGGIY